MTRAVPELSSGPKVQAAGDNPARYRGLVDETFAEAIAAFSEEILVQSGVVMLGQAQQSPSLVLTLLQCQLSNAPSSALSV